MLQLVSHPFTFFLYFLLNKNTTQQLQAYIHTIFKFYAGELKRPAGPHLSVRHMDSFLFSPLSPLRPSCSSLFSPNMFLFLFLVIFFLLVLFFSSSLFFFFHFPFFLPLSHNFNSFLFFFSSFSFFSPFSFAVF